MNYTSILRISAPLEKYKEISSILQTEPTDISNFWELIIEQKENNQYTDAIDFFMKLLEGKYDLLNKNGIEKNDIAVWVYYEYKEQCNMEFSPDNLYRLGKNGISLCISCWQAESQ